MVLVGRPLPPGFIFGLTLSNNGTDAVNDIDVAAGRARDSTDVGDMILAASITKRIDASWAVGSGNGGLDGTESSAGTPDTSTWYHVWLIKRVDTGVVDVLFSESATAPTMPTNYTLKRRIGSVFNNSSGDISAFKQDGDDFQWLVPVNAVNTTNPGTSAVTATLRVPTGVRVKAWIAAWLNNVTSSGSTLYISDLSVTDSTPGSSINLSLAGAAAGANTVAAGDYNIYTNTSAQIRYRLDLSGASDTVRMTAKGWTDTRGRFA